MTLEIIANENHKVDKNDYDKIIKKLENLKKIKILVKFQNNKNFAKNKKLIKILVKFKTF